MLAGSRVKEVVLSNVYCKLSIGFPTKAPKLSVGLIRASALTNVIGSNGQGDRKELFCSPWIAFTDSLIAFVRSPSSRSAGVKSVTVELVPPSTFEICQDWTQ